MATKAKPKREPATGWANPEFQPLRKPPAVRQSSAMPTQKVVASTIAGALVTIIIAVMNERFHVQLTETETAGLTVIIMTAVSYLMPPAPRDTISKRG
jgi:hypothetical protein